MPLFSLSVEEMAPFKKELDYSILFISRKTRLVNLFKLETKLLALWKEIKIVSTFIKALLIGISPAFSIHFGLCLFITNYNAASQCQNKSDPCWYMLGLLVIYPLIRHNLYRHVAISESIINFHCFTKCFEVKTLVCVQQKKFRRFQNILFFFQRKIFQRRNKKIGRWMFAWDDIMFSDVYL